MYFGGGLAYDEAMDDRSRRRVGAIAMDDSKKPAIVVVVVVYLCYRTM